MEQKLKILLVEDDPNLGTLLSEYLNTKGNMCTLAEDGQKGLEAFKNGDYNFLILDVMMPIMDGFTLAKEVRKIDASVPIIFLTAKSMKEDTLEGFAAGADDYLTKPFSMEELMARVRAVSRRIAASKSEVQEKDFQIGTYHFDYLKRHLVREGDTMRLTTKESELLYMLSRNKNQVLERNFALKEIWGDDNYFNGRSMDVYIAKLRKYLKDDENVEIINVHGQGFKLIA
jgi:two-component system OmpR family response regulator